MAIRAITWNIKAGQNPDGSYPATKTANLDKIAEEICKSGASIACLQEVDAFTARSGETYQAGHITSKLKKITGEKWYHKYITSIKLNPGLYGNAVISKHPLKTILRAVLPKVYGHENRSFLLVYIEMENFNFYAGTFHLGLNGDHYIHARQIKEKLENHGLSNCKLLIGGDLNAAEGTETYNIMTSYKFPLIDTGPRNICNYKIDFWFEHDIPAETSKSKVLPVDISDHRPVLVYVNPEQR